MISVFSKTTCERIPLGLCQYHCKTCSVELWKEGCVVLSLSPLNSHDSLHSHSLLAISPSAGERERDTGTYGFTPRSKPFALSVYLQHGNIPRPSCSAVSLLLSNAGLCQSLKQVKLSHDNRVTAQLPSLQIRKCEAVTLC